MSLHTIRKRRITLLAGLAALVLLSLPWVSGQLIAWKVERQIAAIDSHPAFSVIEQSWQSGYALSKGQVIIAERVGCGSRTCSETRVDFAAQHIQLWPFAWGKVTAVADLNNVLQHQLHPPVAPLVANATVGLFGQSSLFVHMNPSWHELNAERADAIAFSGIDVEFFADNYAANWVGELNASFTVIAGAASQAQRDRLSQMMQSLGNAQRGQIDNMGVVIVRVVALMKELASAVQLWHGKERAWQPQIEALPITQALVTAKAPPAKTLQLQITPDILVSTDPAPVRKVALELPSFECWHGDNPMPEVVNKIDNATREREPELDIWQLKLSWSGESVTLNGLALWQK